MTNDQDVLEEPTIDTNIEFGQDGVYICADLKGR
jgi:hypothetical protein